MAVVLVVHLQPGIQGGVCLSAAAKVVQQLLGGKWALLGGFSEVNKRTRRRWMCPPAPRRSTTWQARLRQGSNYYTGAPSGRKIRYPRRRNSSSIPWRMVFPVLLGASLWAGWTGCHSSVGCHAARATLQRG